MKWLNQGSVGCTEKHYNYAGMLNLCVNLLGSQGLGLLNNHVY